MNNWKWAYFANRPNGMNYSISSSRGCFWLDEKPKAIALMDLLNNYERLLYNSNLQNDEFYIKAITNLLKFY